MQARFIHEGKSIDYMPAVDVKAGDVVVQGELVGVAQCDIPAFKLGALLVEGVCDFPKADDGTSTILAGHEVYWDQAERLTKTDNEAGANKYIGKCIRAAGNAEAIVRVRLSQ